MFNLVFVNLNDVKLINVIYLNNLFEVNWLEYKKITETKNKSSKKSLEFKKNKG